MNSNRREFLAQTGLLALAALPTARSAGASAAVASSPPAGLPADWRTLRKHDAHNHVFSAVNRPNADWSEVDAMVEAAAVLGIEKVCCSHPITAGVLADIAAVRDANDSVLAAMKRYPDRILGYCFVQPGNGPQALDEIERCLDAGMIGVKLYNQFKYTDPVIYPIAEKCIQRQILFLGHSAYITDERTLALQPKTSNALEFCVLAQRYPELKLILGHVNGGGDWEWAIKGLRECTNVYLDTSGSLIDDGTIELCVRELGHRRILFATDQTMEGCVGKILSAEITTEQREDIFWRNLQRLMTRRSA
jgi:predicted TIM-barrel fold metal-dependent hydrolase